MLRIIAALTLLLGLATTAPLAAAQSSEQPALAADAPDRHIVVPGDTLWGIAGKFLKDPWRWPDLWKMNKDQVKNPHRIYPGDVIVLDRSSATVSIAKPVKLEPKVYASEQRVEIPSIPPNIIDPFLSQPLVIETDVLATAPQIVGTQEGRVMLGSGDVAFVRGVNIERRAWSVYRPGTEFIDPDTGELLGHEAFYLGSANMESPGEMATFRITTAKLEIGPGDRLIPTERPPLVAYAPRRPEVPVAARVLTIYGAVAGGQYNIVTLNKGKRDGLEVGHVLALNRHGRAQEGLNQQGVKEILVYPDIRYGLIFVFRTFDRVAYALVMQASGPVQVGDAAYNP